MWELSVLKLIRRVDTDRKGVRTIPWGTPKSRDCRQEEEITLDMSGPRKAEC